MDFVTYVGQLPRGGKKILALQLGIASSYLSRLVAGDRSITAERALQIEEVTLGQVSRQELRPDLPWSDAKYLQDEVGGCTRTNTPPILNTNLRTTSPRGQSTDGAGVLSSVQQGSA